MWLHNLVILMIVGIYCGFVDSSLNPNGQNVCTKRRSQSNPIAVYERYSYTSYTGCGWWIRCRRTKYRTRCVYRLQIVYVVGYVCCPGWRSLPSSDECTEYVCNPRCIHGTCVGPNQCLCDPGYQGIFCENPEHGPYA